MKKFLMIIYSLLLSFCSFSQETKVDLVLSKMSPRAQRELKINDKSSFIKELNEVLDEEKRESFDDLNLLYLVDKKNGLLKSSFVPNNLVAVENPKLYKVNKSGMTIRKEVKEKLEEMVRAFDEDTNRSLFVVSSAYRSFDYQKNLFNYWVSVDGLEEAERESARPGTSQHQLGTAMDFGSIDDSFAQTLQGKWMYENAWKFGWSLSFPKNYEDITGFRWESWHFRYIGKKACALQRKYFKDVQQYMLEFIDLWKKN